jgi:integrase
MYIEKHPKGYRAHVQKNGQRKSAIWPTKREAQAWGIRTEAEIELRGKEGDEGATFGQAADRYMLEVSAKKEGARWEILRLTSMKAYFDGYSLAEVGAPEIAKWRDWRLNGDKDHKPVAGSTVQREKNLMRNMFTVARDEWKWMTHRPFDGVSMPKENEHRTALWNWRKIRRILRFLGYAPGKAPKTDYQQVALAFMIGLHTSLRASEILRVSSDTFNPITRVIRIKTKTLKMAQVPVPRRAVKVCKLAKFTINARDLDALFRKARDATLAGDFTFHDSRAFALTMMARKVDILTLSRISQHKDLKQLQRYYRETVESVASRL